MTKLNIFCLTSKNYSLLNKLPKIITPLMVGNHTSDNKFLNENTGINISHLNKYYAEMTGIYWVFKNKITDFTDDDWIGFCHYRRLWLNKIYEKKTISISSIYDKMLDNFISNKKNFNSIMIEPTILKRESIVEHFINNHGPEIFDFLNEILDKNTYDDFNKYLKKNKFSTCNMFITKPKIFSNYCNIIFPIMNKLYVECEKRNLCVGKNIKLPAFLIERFTSFWFEKNTNIEYLSYAVLNKFYLSNIVNKFINPLKLPLSFSGYPTKLDI